MFTRENTKQIKGIAILLMLAHHLFTFPERIPFGHEVFSWISISGRALPQLIGIFGKICVALYMFLAGYGLFFAAVKHQPAAQNTNPDKPREVVIRSSYFGRAIINLYRAYWKVFLIFIPIGFLFFGNQPVFNDADTHAVFVKFNLIEWVSAFVGYRYPYNKEWWFLSAYCFGLFTGYVFIEGFKNRRMLFSELMTVIVWHLLVSQVFPIWTATEPWEETLQQNFWFANLFCHADYVSFCLLGIVFAKYDLFRALKKLADPLSRIEKIAVSLLIMSLCVYARVFYEPIHGDLLFVPIWIVACLLILEACPRCATGLAFLGTHSTNMWLTHTFFCYYFYPAVQLVYGSRIPILIFLTLLAFSLASSFALDGFWALLSRGRKRLLARIPG